MKRKLIIGSIIVAFIVGMIGVYFIVGNSNEESKNKTSSDSSVSTKDSSSSTSTQKKQTTYEDDGKDVIVKDETFLSQMNDIFEKTDNYIGRKITVEGIVQSINSDKGFAVARKYDENHGNHYDEVMVGIIALYSGDLPKVDSWVEVSGTIEKETIEGTKQPIIKVDKVTVKDTRGQEKIYN